MSKWAFGCGKKIEVVVPHGRYDSRAITVECGSSAHDGGVNQCDACEKNHPVSDPYEDEGDMEWFDRQGGEDAE
jgi:hypothetical protein